MKITEKLVHETILRAPGECLNGLEVLRSEVPLIGALEYLQRDVYEDLAAGNTLPASCVGRIDLVMKYRGKVYVTEIKYRAPDNRSSDFWDALKVVGYCAYYKWQYEVKGARPAIIMPRGSVKLEHQVIAGSLGLQIFGAFTSNGVLKLKPILDTPIWKQGG